MALGLQDSELQQLRRYQQEVMLLQQQRNRRDQFAIRERDPFFPNSMRRSWDMNMGQLSNTRGGFIPDKPSTTMLAVMPATEVDLQDERVSLALQVEDILGYTPLRKDVKAPSRLHRALAEMEIDVYKIETVGQYKEKMRAHFQAKIDSERGGDRRTVMGEMYYIEVTWIQVGLKGYAKPVPEHVLAKCIQIKQSLPEANFVVDELVEQKRTLDPFMYVEMNGEKAYFEVWDEPEFEKANT